MKIKVIFAASILGGIFAMIAIYPRSVIGRKTIETTGPVTVTRRATAEDIVAFDKMAADPETIRLTTQATKFSCAIKGMTISSNGGWILLAVEAELLDKREGFHYRWGLDVFEEQTNERVVHLKYDDQLFVSTGQEMQPMFAERFRIQPGDYRVEVMLHRIPIGFDFSLLEQPKVDRSHRVISIFKSVVVDQITD